MSPSIPNSIYDRLHFDSPEHLWLVTQNQNKHHRSMSNVVLEFQLDFH